MDGYNPLYSLHVVFRGGKSLRQGRVTYTYYNYNITIRSSLARPLSLTFFKFIFIFHIIGFSVNW